MVLVQREFELTNIPLSCTHAFARHFSWENCGNICLKFSLLFYGIAIQIFDLLDSGLPADFLKKYGLSWNLLKASIGNGRGKTKI